MVQFKAAIKPHNIHLRVFFPCKRIKIKLLAKVNQSAQNKDMKT